MRRALMALIATAALLCGICTAGVAEAGARGLATGFVDRRDHGYPASMEPPDVIGADLTEVVDRILHCHAHGGSSRP